MSVGSVASTSVTYNYTLENNSIYIIGFRAISSQGNFVVGTKYDGTVVVGSGTGIGSCLVILTTDSSGNILPSFTYGGYAVTVTKNSSSFVVNTNPIYSNHSYGLFKLV